MPLSAATVDAANALPLGQRLHEFVLRDVIGVGGFGIVYRAFDLSLEREVAIKEYMPAALAGRSQKMQVSLLSQSNAETFSLGLRSFVNEAKLLAQFDHPSLVKVHRFWEEHGTAYMVMPLYRGHTLRQLRQGMTRAPGEAWIRQVLEHLLGALEVMHREGVYHRDIAPDNILVTDEGLSILLDFGAARRVISDRSQNLTAILKPSYAPLEQYAESTGMRQGPWTDFYALGATLHLLITGKPPLPSTARAITDEQQRLAGSGQGGLSDTLLQLCDWMLAPRPQDRPQNAAEVRAALAGRLPIPVRPTGDPAAKETVWHSTVVDPPSPPPPLAPDLLEASMSGRWRAVAVPVLTLIGVAVMAGAAALWLAGRDDGMLPLHAAPMAPAAVTTGTSTTATPVAAPVSTNESALAAAGSQVALDGNTAANPTFAAPGLHAATEAAPGKQTAAGAGPGASTQGRDALAAHNAAANVPPAAAGAAPTVAAARSDPPARPKLISRTPAQGDTQSAKAIVAPARAAVPSSEGNRAGARDPRDSCAGRHLIALQRCLSRECAKADYSQHRVCERVRQAEERQRQNADPQRAGS